MTVKELKEELNNFPDDYDVIFPIDGCHYSRVEKVSKGFNELDGFIIIDDCND